MVMSAEDSLRRPEPIFAELFTPKLVTILREGCGWGDFRAGAPCGSHRCDRRALVVHWQSQ